MSRYRSSADDDAALGCFGMIFLGACVLVWWLWFSWQSSAMGINGYGPVRQYDVVVILKHIDSQAGSSIYVVNGDTQTFEVDNGPLLGIWNADVVYGKIIVGERYCITAKGNQVTAWWWLQYPYMQQYPYILKAVKGGC